MSLICLFKLNSTPFALIASLCQQLPLRTAVRRYSTLGMILAGILSRVEAQTTTTWTSTSDTTFSTGSNWTLGAPVNDLSSNSAAFTGAGTAQPLLTISQSLQGLSFTGGAYTFSATGGAQLTLGAGGITTTAGNHTVSADIALGANQSWTPGSGLQFTASGSISGSSALTKAGAGTLTLSGLSTFTGRTMISAGTISLDSIADLGTASALGAPTTTANGTIAIGNATIAGALIYTGATASTNRVINLAGNTGGVTLTGSGTGALTFTSNFTLTLKGNKTVTLNGSTAGNTITGAIPANTGGTTTSLAKSGSGSWILSGTNTYNGTTTISDGILQIGAGGTTGSVASTSIAITSTGALVFNRSDALTYAGVVSGSGTGGVTQAGSGTLTLSGTNTYTGTTTVSAGTLLVNGSLASGSAVTIASGGTLGGTGTVNGATTVSSGGTLAPGTSPSLLTFGGNLTLNTGSTSVFEINGTDRGSTFDAINVAGLTTYGGTFTLSFGTTVPDATTLNLLSLTGGSAGGLNYVTATGSYTGSFTNNSGVWSLTTGGQSLTFTESTGNLAIAASAIPEPSTYAALLGAAACLAVAWRRRALALAAYRRRR